MTATQRRDDMLCYLLQNRHAKIAELMARYKVSERTVRYDVEELTRAYPLKAKQGKYGGGIYVEDWFHLNMRYLAPEQMDLLRSLAPTLKDDERKIINSILAGFSMHTVSE